MRLDKKQKHEVRLPAADRRICTN